MNRQTPSLFDHPASKILVEQNTDLRQMYSVSTCAYVPLLRPLSTDSGERIVKIIQILCTLEFFCAAISVSEQLQLAPPEHICHMKMSKKHPQTL